MYTPLKEVRRTDHSRGERKRAAQRSIAERKEARFLGVRYEHRGKDLKSLQAIIAQRIQRKQLPEGAIVERTGERAPATSRYCPESLPHAASRKGDRN